MTDSPSLQRVDPELRRLLESFPPLLLSLEDLPRIRAEGAEFWKQLNAAAATAAADSGGAPVRCEQQLVAGPPGAPQVRVLLYRPSQVRKPMPAYLQIHGGGYVLGSAEGSESANRELASALSALVVAVDYRLAPETRAPGSVEDCYAALQWLHDNAADLGVDAARIAIGGESAGGGLAAALALLTRDRGSIGICFQNLVYPMLDDRTAVLVNRNPHTGHHLWTHEHNRFGWSALLGGAPGAVGISPYAAPARAADLRGLPPALITVGQLDLFLEEDIDYATRLMQSGVPTELHVYPGAYHGFDLEPAAQVSQAMRRDRLNALRRALAV
ncbi:MAG: alpha/beta hydrolase [Steroidobacteraceae bacterium]